MTDSSVERGKQAAAFQAVDDNIHTDCVVGVGSGSTMPYVLQRLSHRCRDLNIRVKCIPTSFQSKQLVYDHGLAVTELNCEPEIDVAIDGADEVDENLVAIKGGGACLAQEKVVAYAAKKFIVVADDRKSSKYLGQNWKKGIPIEVLPMACYVVRRKICDLFCIDLDDILVRIGKEKAGPVVTDNGNFIIDWKWKVDKTTDFSSESWKNIADQLVQIPGVVDVGIFAGVIKTAYFGDSTGAVKKVD